MIVPLFLEQLLVMLVGLADTFFISQAGEAAVAGVSLVNQFNTVFIYLFTALASGGAVVISQYFGNQDKEHSGEASGQLLMFSITFSVIVMALVLIGNRLILRLLFGNVENDVMDACVTYLRISAYSYPALAIYNVRRGEGVFLRGAFGLPLRQKFVQYKIVHHRVTSSAVISFFNIFFALNIRW